MEENVSKKRTTNFQGKEEKMLIELVKKYAHIIENKKTDAVSVKQKMDTWAKVEKEFNPNNEIYRSALVLKNKYENLKRVTKKRAAEELRYNRGTGGGPPKKFKISEVEEEIRAILGTQLSGLPARFDDDATLIEIESDIFSTYLQVPSTSTQGIIIDDIEPEHSCSIEPEGKLFNSADWSDVTPSKLKTPVSTPLRTKNYNKENTVSKTNLSNKISRWVMKKESLIEIEREQKKKNLKKKWTYLIKNMSIEKKDWTNSTIWKWKLKN